MNVHLLTSIKGIINSLFMTKTTTIQLLRASVVFTLLSLFAFSVSTTLANHFVMPDTDEDGFISVIEGVPFYGGIVSSLTTEGDTSVASALALERFPVADKKGQIKYNRTFTLDNVEDLTSLHVVIHGIDIDNSGAYDGEKPNSLGVPGVPFEATVPAACGEIEINGKSNVYQAKINQLNSTGASGHLQMFVDGNEVTVKYNVKGLSPNLAHAQHFHMGGDNVCPPNTIGIKQY